MDYWLAPDYKQARLLDAKMSSFMARDHEPDSERALFPQGREAKRILQDKASIVG
jgi:hypothetical protein